MSDPNTQNLYSVNTEPTPQTSAAVLEKFVFEPDGLAAVVVPRRLSPRDVATFLSQPRINRELSPRSWRQVEQVADFYDAIEVPSIYKQLLGRKETSADDRVRSAIIARVIGTLGNDGDREFARQYYLYLVPLAETSQEFQELASLRERLMLTSGIELRQSLEKRISYLESKQAADYQLRLMYLELREKMLPKLDVVNKAVEVESKTLKIADRSQRISEEVKLYVNGDDSAAEFLQAFAARRLRRETWAAAVADQNLRNDKAPLKDDVIRALRSFYDSLDKKGLEASEKVTFRIRTLRAIKFFDGRLSSVEESFLRKNRGKQTDILANEGMLIQS